MTRHVSPLRCSGALALGVVLFAFVGAHAQTDPLPSWNDGPAKKAILEFVRATTDKASPKFVPPEARIATFDQDGTTWVEQPMYTQVVYCLERVPAHDAGLEGSLPVGEAVRHNWARQS